MPDDLSLLNPVWSTLTGLNSRFAQGNELAARFDPDVSVFCAFPTVEPGEEHWQSMAQLIGPGGTAVVLVGRFEPPTDWTIVGETAGFQMVKAMPGGAAAGIDSRLIELGPSDVDDMLALVSETEPGPFERRTIELGRYVGAQAQGALIAMAGQRMRFDNFVEISAVCTHPASRGTGLASALTADLVATIEADDKQPILHVRQDNAAAIAVYQRLGFKIHRPFTARALQAPARTRALPMIERRQNGPRTGEGRQ